MKRAFLCHLALLVSLVLLSGCSERSSNDLSGGVAKYSGDAASPSAGDEGDMSAPSDDMAGAWEEAGALEAPLPDVASAPSSGVGAASHAARGVETKSASGPSAAPEPAPPPRTTASGVKTDSYRSSEPTHAESAEKRTATTRPARNDIQSGLLTAGSFDDHEHFDAYQKYLSKVMQHDPGETFPRYALGERVEIQVVDPQGRPVGGARLVVRSADQQQDRGELLATVTGSDGRAVFCTGLDRGAGRQAFEVAVTPPGGDETVATFKVAEQPWRITLAKTEASLPRKLDLALVVDTTGSMGDELEYLKVEIDSIVQTVSRMFPNVDQHYALIVYRDQGDEYVTRTFDFTPSLEDFRGHLAAQSANGGGDKPEAVQVAVEHAGKLSWRDGNTARVMFLVGDAPPHEEYLGTTLDLTQSLRDRGVRIYPVAGSGVDPQAQFVFRAMSFLTMGQYLFLTDHSGVGNPHATPDVPEFQVERLDRLMIRMISSELAGKRLAPKEVIAIERGELEPSELKPGELGPGVPPVVEQNEQPDGQAQPAAAAPTAADEASVSPVSLPAIASSPFAWIALGAVVCAAFIGDAIRDRRRGDA